MNSNVKFLYVIDYWDGDGLINLIAENDHDAFEVLSSEESLSVNSPKTMMENIINSQKFQLTDEYESGIIDVFCIS
jgi:hypothetical protein